MEYGYYGEGRKNREKVRRYRIFSPVNAILLVINVAVALALLLSYLAPYVNPNSMWIFAFLGLAAPVLWLVALAFLLYWVVCWRMGYALVSFVAIMVGIGNVSLFFKPGLSRSYDDRTGQPADLRLVSYNVMAFMDKSNGGKSSMDSIAAFVNSVHADVVCMQEFRTAPGIDADRLSSLLPKMPYRKVAYTTALGNGYGGGLAVYSKYPILGSGAVEFANSANSVLWTDLCVNRDTVRLFNSHLQTTSITSSDQEFIVGQEFISDSGREEKIKGMAAKLRRNYRIRANQADSIAGLIASSPYSVIVCGDFNDTPMSYVYHTVRGDMRDAFREKGRGTMNTFRGFFNMLRIDHVFHTRDLEVVEYEVPDRYPYSDHNPVVVAFDIRK